MPKDKRIFIVSLVIAGISVILIHFVDFPGSVPNFRRISHGGQLLDTFPAYTIDELYNRIEEYGEEGRATYLFRLWSIDILLPLSVFPFLLLLGRFGLGSAFFHRSIRFLVFCFPVIYVIFDLCENALLYFTIANFPQRIELASAITVITLIKKAGYIAAVISPMLLLAYRGARLIAAKRIE